MIFIVVTKTHLYLFLWRLDISDQCLPTFLLGVTINGHQGLCYDLQYLYIYIYILDTSNLQGLKQPFGALATASVCNHASFNFHVSISGPLGFCKFCMEETYGIFTGTVHDIHMSLWCSCSGPLSNVSANRLLQTIRCVWSQLARC